MFWITLGYEKVATVIGFSKDIRSLYKAMLGALNVSKYVQLF